MKKINLLLLNSVLTGGGAEHVIATLARNINKDQFNIFIAYIQQGGVIKELLEREGFKIISIPDVNTKYMPNNSITRILSILKKHDIQIVHTHDIRSLVDTSLCRLFNRRIKHVHTFHYGNYPRTDKKHYMLEKLFIRFPNQLVAVGEMQNKMIRDSYSIAGYRLNTIWNGVDPINPEVNKEIKASVQRAEKFVVGSISTLIEQKGVEYLLMAIADLRKIRNDFILVIAGGGHLRETLDKRARQLNIEDITIFTGWVDDASESILPIFDVFVQSSLWEAMSMVILEAMASNKAIVATTVGENEKVLLEGETGILVSPKDPHSLANAINRLLENDDLRKSMAASAYTAYCEKFTGKRMAGNYENLFISLVNDKPS